jgi:DNA-binding NtrC family response regulator
MREGITMAIRYRKQLDTSVLRMRVAPDERVGREAIMPERFKRKRAAPTVVLMGLAEGLAEDLRKALSQQGCAVRSEPQAPRSLALRLIDQVEPDVVFCPAEREHFVPFLAAVRAKKPGLPVVVVSRLPEVPAWLDAMELGAADYCAPPFESIQIRWILQSALKTPCSKPASNAKARARL